MTYLSHPGALQRFTTDERGVDLYFQAGRMCVQLIGEGTARIRFTQGEEFRPRRSWDVVPDDGALTPGSFSIAETEEAVEIRSDPLRIRVSRTDGKVAFVDDQGRRFASDLTPVSWWEADLRETVLDEREREHFPPGVARIEVRVTKSLAPDEGLYGFGERIGLLDRRGRKLSNWTADPDWGHGRGLDNMYQAHPTFMAVRPGLAWGCFLHSTCLSSFDCGLSNWDELELRTLGGELDYYIFYGPTPADVVDKLTALTGHPCLPPLWALGYHQSRWGYMHDREFREIARGFRERDIPIDVLHFDIDYMRGYRDFTWDPERIPDPAGLLADLREQGIRAVTIIDPGVKADLNNGYRVADEGVERGMFIQNADGTPFTGYCWPDAVLFPDFARADVRAWWGEQHRGHLESGVAGIWNDMNEPAIFDRPFSEGFSKLRPMPPDTPQGDEGEQTTHAEVHNLYGLLMSRATHEGLRELRPDERPWILTRSGFTGVGRYAAVWMGDNSSWWEHLEASLPQLASMGLSGVPHVGVDVGGFWDNPSAELYARWVLMGVFYPFMRTHTKADTNAQEPWSFGPEVEEISRRAIKLRYRLLPYPYTLAHEAHRTGAPILRPMLYDFPDDPAGYHLHDQLMFGPHMLVAPVYHPGRLHRMVYLPEGAWYNYWSGERFDGPAAVVAQAPLDTIPVYVRGGAILSLGNDRNSTNEPLTELTLMIYPSGESEWTWIEDDGQTFAYERGELAETTVRVAQDDGQIQVHVNARKGVFQPHPRTLALQIRTYSRPAIVTLDGSVTQDWRWDEGRGVVLLDWEDDGRGHEVELEA